MSDKKPRVSIGVPVFNGEDFLSEALDSILAQTYPDFELIISDNASTDHTPEICRAVVARDPRVRYCRNEINLGAAKNFNRTFKLSSGEYFKWAAHDDLCAPDFLIKCIEVLDQDPSVVLCHTKVQVINEQGKIVENYTVKLNTDAPRAHERFHDLIDIPNRCYEAFGLIRADTLRTTPLMGGFPVADRILLAELAFRGRFHEIPEYLFFPRAHPQQSTKALPTQHQRAVWFDPSKEGRILFPEWRTFIEYCKAIRRAPLNGYDRIWCYLYMVDWLRHYRKRMRSDVIVAAKQFLRSL